MSNLTFYTSIACAGLSSVLITFSYYKQKKNKKTVFATCRKLKRSKSSPHLNLSENEKNVSCGSPLSNKVEHKKNVLWGWFSK